MKDLISVIVPVYNVAAYLPQCLQSILTQTYETLEVILIDDGSTDDSGRICDEYAAKDSRIRVIHQKNAGAAAAKNAGLRIATGEYLSFVDSDDYLEPGAYQYMHAVLKDTGADAGEFSFRDVYRSRSEEHVLYPERTIVNGLDYLRQFTRGWNCALLWNKLYKRSLFEGVFFEEGHRIDDEFFTYQGFLNADKVVCDGHIVYNYRKRRSGAMGDPKAGQQRMLDRVDFMEQRREKVGSRFPELKREFDLEFLNAMVYFTAYSENTEVSLKRIRTAVLGYFKTKGNTFPPKYLWKGLLSILLISPEKQLEKITKPQNDPSMDTDEFA